MDLNGFNALEIEPATSYEVLPANWYKCVITDTEEKPTKAMTGSYLQLTIEVIEGDYQGRKVFDRLNLKNPNSVAVEIAQRSLSSICRAIDVPNPKDSIELRDKPLMVKISVKSRLRATRLHQMWLRLSLVRLLPFRLLELLEVLVFHRGNDSSFAGMGCESPHYKKRRRVKMKVQKISLKRYFEHKDKKKDGS